MQLTTLSPADAPDASRPILEGIAGDLGFVPNMAATIAASPALLTAFDGLRRAVSGGSLDPVLREVAGLAVGVAVDNHYGVAFHSTVLGKLGVDRTEIDAIRAGGAPSDTRMAAVHALATAVVLGRGKVDAAIVDAASEQGLDVNDMLEVVAECTFAGLVGTVDNLAGRVDLDAFLHEHAWSR